MADRMPLPEVMGNGQREQHSIRTGFRPLTGSTAGKTNDAFVEPNRRLWPIDDFPGDALAQRSPMLPAFQVAAAHNPLKARGYTAWDPSSPAFICAYTLYPTVFVSYTGEALVTRYPLLRQLNVLDTAQLMCAITLIKH